MTRVFTVIIFSVVCLVFDLSDWKSLEHVSAWFSDAENANPGEFITFLIGTKSDLVVVSLTSFLMKLLEQGCTTQVP
jgi:hypothetical protein